MKKHILCTVAFLAIFAGSCLGATTFYQDDFNDGNTGALKLQSNWQVTSSGGKSNSRAIKLTYATKGTPGNQATLNLESFNTQELWIEFDAKIEGSMNGGMKFVKIFGSSTTHSQNNSTFLMNYSSNTMVDLMYKGDSLCGLKLNGNNYSSGSCIYTPVKTISSVDLRGNVWRRVKMHFVRAAPGQNTGSYRMWVDGVEKFHFKNVNNNSPVSSATNKIAYITFGDYTNSNNSTWHFWIDNLTVSGTGSAPSPDPTPDPDPDPTPSSASITWDKSSYTVSESAGSATFKINRSGDTSGSSTVEWGTFQDTASVGDDYTGISWTPLTFAAGESSKTVSVPIIDDSLIEGSESFTLSLRNPTKASLGSTTNATVAITDNDTASGALPAPKNLTVIK